MKTFLGISTCTSGMASESEAEIIRTHLRSVGQLNLPNTTMYMTYRSPRQTDERTRYKAYSLIAGFLHVLQVCKYLPEVVRRELFLFHET